MLHPRNLGPCSPSFAVGFRRESMTLTRRLFILLCSHLAVFVIEREGLARLDFIQNMEYKFVELLS